MSQHIYPALADGRAVRVQIGYDRPLTRYYLLVEYEEPVPDPSEPGEVIDYLYDNLADPVLIREPHLDRDLDYFATVLTKLHLTPIESIMSEVRQDGANNVGNRVVRYDCRGVVIP